MVTFLAIPLPYMAGIWLDIFQLTGFVMVCVASVVSVTIFAYLAGLNTAERREIADLVKEKFYSKIKKGE